MLSTPRAFPRHAGPALALLVGALLSCGKGSSPEVNTPTRASARSAAALNGFPDVVGWGYDGAGQISPPAGLSGVRAVAAGEDHSLALLQDGTVIGWGSDAYGQASVPQGLTGVVAIAAGEYHSVALRADGTVVTWGGQTANLLGVPAGTSGVIAIAAGNEFTIALRSDGTVTGWGANLGPQALDVPAGLKGVVAISAGLRHVLALRGDGTVVGWGTNLAGQIAVPAGLTGVVGISAGQAHSLAVRRDGTVVAWGSNSNGQAPPFIEHTGVVAVAAGNLHSAALKADGTVVSWGNNSLNEQGIPAGLSGVTAIAGGGYFTLALTAPLAPAPTIASVSPSSGPSTGGTAVTISGSNFAPGLLVAFGSDASRSSTLVDAATVVAETPPSLAGIVPVVVRNLDGQMAIADGSYDYLFDPPQVVVWGHDGSGQSKVPVGLTRVTSLVLGEYHALAVRAGGTVVAWGANDQHQAEVPANLTGVSAVAAGYAHSLALKSDGTVVGWGSNQMGETTIPQGLSGVVAIAAGQYYSAGLMADGTVTVWGGQSYMAPPPEATGIVAIAGGRYNLLGLRADGTVVGWGNNPLGLRSVPAGLTGVTAIAVGPLHSVALKSDGTVISWGSDVYRAISSQPAGIIDAVAIAAGELHTLVLRADGTIVGWGSASYGVSTAPVGVSGVSAIAAGSAVSGAVLGTFTARPPFPTGVSPSAGPTAGGTLVSITGSDLASVVSVTFNGTPATLISATATQVVVRTPPGVEGAASVVLTSDLSQAAPVYGFDYVAPPVVTCPAPVVAEATMPLGAIVTYPTASATGARTSTFTYSQASGTVFPLAMTPVTATATDTVGNTASCTFTVEVVDTTPPTITCPPDVSATATSASGIAVNYPLASAKDLVTPTVWLFYSHPSGSVFPVGTTLVTVTGEDGLRNAGSCTFTVNVTLAPITLSGVSPPSGPLGGGTAITVTGSGFQAGATMTVGGTVATSVSVVSSTTITAVTPAGTAGTAPVTVTLTDGRSATLASAFAYLAPSTITCPAAATVEATGPTGAVATYAPATATGTVPVTIAYSKASGSLFPLGTTSVTATATDAAGQSASCTFAVSVVDTTSPAVTCPAPASATAAATAGVAVSYPAATADDAVTPNPTITYSQPSGTVFPVGTTPVTVTATDAAGNVGSCTFSVSVTLVPITISGVSPSSGPLAGGTGITVTGSGFQAGATVTVGGAAATSVMVASDTTLTAVTPAGVGWADVAVTLADGRRAVATAAFQYVAAPTITSIAANHGPMTGGTTVTITGTGFLPGGAVLFGGIPAVTVSVLDPTRILVSTPAGHVGPVTVTVQNPDGQVAKRYAGFRFTSLPGWVVGWGDDTSRQASVPPGLSGVTQVAAGGAHSVALRADGTVTGWGDDSFGQASAPTGLTGVVAVAAGGSHTLALRSDGTVVAWGSNTWGQRAVPAGLVDVVAIAAGPMHSVALKADGSVVSWGTATAGTGSATPVLSNVTAVAAGAWNTAAIRGDGTVVVWGAPDYGHNLVPAGLGGASEATIGDYHVSALQEDGTITSWSYVPGTLPQGAGPAVSVSAAGMATGVVTASGNVLILGYGVPAVPSGLSAVTGLSLGTSHVLALTTNPPPVPLRVEPPQGPIAGGATATVVGSGFIPGASVSFGGVAASVTSISATAISLIVPAHASGVVDVVVTNGDGQQATIRSGYLYQAGPVISCPASMSMEASGSTGAIAIYPPATASGAEPVSIAYSQASGSPFPLGTTIVTATATDALGQVAACTFTVNVIDTTPPALTCPAPVSATATTSAGMAVSYPAATATDVVTASPVIAYSKASGTVFPVGTTPVTATATDAAGNAANCTFDVTVAPVPVTIASVTPGSGPAAGGTFITVTGTGFQVGATVTVGGKPATSVSAVSDTTLTATTPAGAPGWADVAVTLLDGRQALATGAFLYVPIPAITSVSPRSGPATGGTTVTITGSNFATGASVTIGGMAALAVTVLDAGTIVVDVPPGLPGPVAVTVRNPDGQGGSRAAGFHYRSVPSQVVTWGDNTYTQTDLPPGLSGVVAIGTGDVHSLALRADGTLVGWGWNVHGPASIPPGLTDVLAIGPGGYHSIVLQDSGTVRAWGYNAYGQANVPADVGDVTAVAGGAYHSLALRGDGTVAAWGDGRHGETAIPPGLSDVVAIDAGGWASMALKSDGTVVAWGDPTTGQAAVPAGLSGVVAIAMGSSHAAALKSDGTVVVWGDDTFGQRVVPAGLANVIAIGAGSYHMVALKADGRVEAWGYDVHGESRPPTGLVEVSAISVGGYHTVGLTPSPPPVVTSFSPAMGPTTGGTVVEVSGSGFQAGATVAFGAVAGLVTAVTPTTITVTAPAQAAGVVDVVVRNADGQSVRVATAFTYVGPPAITCPAPVTIEATGSTGATATYAPATATGTAPVTIAYTTVSGSPFPMGTTNVTATATDALGQTASCTFTVGVVDTTPPTVTCPAPVSVTAATTAGVAVTYPAATATDVVTASPAIAYSKAPGTVFPVGTTAVTATATDAAGNASTCTFSVNVTVAPPTITCPAATTAEATGPTGAIATYAPATATGMAPVTIGYSAASGSLFPLGTTIVSATATDVAGQTATCTFTVSVVDTTPPAVTCPAPVSATATTNAGVAVSYPAVTATDAVTAAPTIAYSQASGTVFPVGTTPVTVTATDTAGNAASCSFDVVVSASAPSISSVTPVSGPSAGGTTVTIRGNGFASGVTVAIAGVSASAVNVVDATTITAVTPPGLVGPASVVVSGAGGQSATRYGGFTYLSSPGYVFGWGLDDYGQTRPPAGLDQVVAIAAGLQHSLALRADGTVAAWGSDTIGQATVPAELGRVIAVAAGGFHSLALREDGTVAAWGDGSFGATSVPSGLADVTSIAAGYYHSVALKADGTVVAWGENMMGQTSVPGGLSGIVAVAAGLNHSLALRSDGTVVAWGDDGFGQSSVPAGLTGVRAIAAGYMHSLALRSNGDVVAWGWNDSGQSTVPSGLPAVSSIAGGRLFSVVAVSNGTVTAWGGNPDGQLALPAQLQGVSVVAAGNAHGLALTSVPPPSVASISPASGPSGGGTNVTITGTGFQPGAWVIIGANAAMVGSVTPTTITATTPAGYSGKANVEIRNPDTRTSVLPGGFTFVEPPVVTCPASVSAEAIGPTGAPVSYPAATATGEAPVTIDYSKASGSIFRLGTTNVYAAAMDGLGQTAGCVFTVTVVDTTPPAISCPASITATATSATGGVVSYPEATATDLVTVGPSIAYSVPSGAMFQIGTTPVTVTATDGAGNASSCTFGVTVDLVPVSIAGVTPPSGPASGGTAITVTGAGFQAGATVTVGGAAATSVTFVSETTLMAVTPAGVTGWTDVAVTLPDGRQAVAASAFEYVAAPTITSLSPWYGSASGGTTVTISGTGFRPGATVLFGGTPAVVVSVVDPTRVVVSTPPGFTGTAIVTVRNADGQIAERFGGFTYRSVGGDVVAWGSAPVVPAGMSGIDLVAAGNGHDLALRGTVPLAWGDNSAGQLNVPAGIGDVIAVAGGGRHTLAVRTDGTVVGWGANEWGQAVAPTGLSGVVAVAAGDVFSVALKADGTVVAWGWWGDGQTTVPNGLTDVTAIAAGWEHVVALKGDGTLVAWGRKDLGQIAIPAGLRDVVAISARSEFTLALRRDGTVVAWGDGAAGQTSVPVGLSDVIGIAAGGYHSVALRADGTVATWGSNALRQLQVPSGMGAFTAIAAGRDHTIALTTLPTPVPVTITPSSRSTSGSVSAIISGSGFLPGAVVQLGTRGAFVTSVSPTTIVVDTPGAPAGTVDVVVTNPNGRSGILPAAFTYVAPPVVTCPGPVIAEATGPTGAPVSYPAATATGTPPVTISYSKASGSTFRLGRTMVFASATDGVGGTEGCVFPVDVVDTTPPAITCPATVTATAPSSTGVAVTYPAATATDLVTASPTITYSQASGTVFPVGTTAVTATATDASANAASCRFDVVVKLPPPVVSGVSPSSGPAAGGTAVVVTGTGFQAGAAVTFGGTPAQVGAVTATSISVTTPAHVAGAVDVTVANPDGQSARLAGAFTFVPPLQLLAVNPPAGPAGVATAVTLTGAGFAPGMTVTFGALAATAVTVASATSATCTAPAGTGTVDVTVSLGSYSSTLAGGFSYVPRPTLTSVSPASGTSLGGTPITITGTSFLPGAIVTLGGTPATNVVVVSSTQITAATPAHAAGTAVLSVTNPYGQARTLAGAFTFTAAPPPQVTAVSPAVGPIAGGTTVTITGRNFAPGATVTIGVAVATATVTSPTTIVAVTAPRAAGNATVTVRNPDGQSGSLTGGFRYLAPPTVTGINPATGTAAGGTALAISGTGFVAGATVTLDGLAATVTSATGGTIRVTTPAHPVGTAQVVVRNPDGQTATSPVAFGYSPLPPTGLSAMGGARQIALAWAAPDGATGYEVLRGNGATGPWALIGATTSTAYVDSTLADGVRRWYVVRATSATGTGPSSASTSALTLPAAPARLTATAGVGQVALSWRSVTSAASYTVLRSPVAGGPYVAVANVAGTNYTDRGLAAGSTYYFVVQARNATGTGPSSTEVSALVR